MAKYTWFEKFISFCWVFSMVFLWSGMFAGSMMNLRAVDAKIGILNKPLTSQFEQANNAIQNIGNIFTPLQANAQQAVFDTGLNPAFNAERVLNQVIRRALANFVTSIVQFILAQFDKLLNAIEQAIQGATGLRLNLGSFRAALALKAFQITQTVNKSINAWMDDVWPIEDANLKRQAANVVAAQQVGAVINESQADLGTGALPNTLPKAELDKAQDQIASTAAATKCSVKELDYQLVQMLGPSVGVSCLREEKAKINEAITQSNNQVKETYRNLNNTINTQAPADCKGMGITEVSSSIEAALASGQPAFASAANLNILNSGSNFSIDPNSAATGILSGSGTFTDNVIKVSQPLDLKPISKEQCDGLSRVQATIAAANTDKSGPQSEDLLDALSKVFTDLISQIFDKLVSSLLNILISAVNKVIGVLPGFMQNFAYEVFGGLTSYATTKLDSLKADILSGVSCVASPCSSG